MKFTQSCGCGSRVEVDTDSGTMVPIINVGAKPDDKGRVFRFEQWIEAWQELHAKCAPCGGEALAEEKNR